MSGTREGDGDPLDVCVFAERPITRSEILVDARVIGGLPMRDAGQADDKIVAVLESDPFWAGVEALDQLPPVLLERLRHYFATYKLRADSTSPVHVGEPYGREHAHEVVTAAMADYAQLIGDTSPG